MNPYILLKERKYYSIEKIVELIPALLKVDEIMKDCFENSLPYYYALMNSHNSAVLGVFLEMEDCAEIYDYDNKRVENDNIQMYLVTAAYDEYKRIAINDFLKECVEFMKIRNEKLRMINDEIILYLTYEYAIPKIRKALKENKSEVDLFLLRNYTTKMLEKHNYTSFNLYILTLHVVSYIENVLYDYLPEEGYKYKISTTNLFENHQLTVTLIKK